MRIVLPLDETEQLSPHFGTAPRMGVFDVDRQQKQILGVEIHTTPPHQPGVIPRWIQTQNADLVIAGDIGERAVIMLADMGIPVILGVQSQPARHVVQAWLEERLETNPEARAHGHHGAEHDNCS